MACFFTSKKKRASCHNQCKTVHTYGMTLFAKHYSGLFSAKLFTTLSYTLHSIQRNEDKLKAL